MYRIFVIKLTYYRLAGYFPVYRTAGLFGRIYVVSSPDFNARAFTFTRVLAAALHPCTIVPVTSFSI